MTPFQAIAASLLLGFAGVNAGAQDQPEKARPEQPPAKEPGPRPERQPEDRESLKARLQRRLDETRQTETRLERALKMLEEGQPEDRVREEAGPLRRGGGEHREPPPGGMPPPPRHGPPQQGPEFRAALVGFIDANMPELSARLKNLGAENPEMLERIYSRIEPHFREIAAERDAEMKDLRTQNLRLGWEIMNAARDLGQALRAEPAGPELEQARQKLRPLLASQFDVQVRLHTREVQLLEQRIARLREEMAEQSSDKDAYVAQKLQQMEAMAKRWQQRERERREGPREGGERRHPKPEGDPKRS
jgi:hypothetical protein